MNLFIAAASGPTIHMEPGVLFKIGEFGITNSILYGAISSVVIFLILVIVANKMTVLPKKGIIQFVEMGTEFILKTMQDALGSRALAIKYAPFFLSTFFFIMLTNWLGLLPGVGDALVHNPSGNPLLRPFTADLNGTLAIAATMMVIVQIITMKESGFVGYMRHFFAGSLKNPGTYLLGIFEMFSELTRVISLAVRLFLNIAIGEVIIAIFAYLGGHVAFLSTLPFVGFELFVGALQAYIFTMLTVMYLGAAIKHGHHDTEHQPKADAIDSRELTAKA